MHESAKKLERSHKKKAQLAEEKQKVREESSDFRKGVVSAVETIVSAKKDVLDSQKEVLDSQKDVLDSQKDVLVSLNNDSEFIKAFAQDEAARIGEKESALAAEEEQTQADIDNAQLEYDQARQTFSTKPSKVNPAPVEDLESVSCSLVFARGDTALDAAVTASGQEEVLSPEEQALFSSMKMPDLKAALKANSLPVNGRKKELVKRLAAFRRLNSSN
ncbi:MAG: hypothetical protein SGARI_002250 [Bacillariaceae sp.]